ncbi:interleukin-18-like [Hyla sarda]|uniref:interleukin-18-like n=1 Tax=Hyla sarda TaxID=327740 RepID=UPI0024C2D489|nr:interleukin-18-like [Hyla sarda]
MDRKSPTHKKVRRKVYDEVDAFKLKDSPAIQQHFKNHNNEWLIAHPEKSIAYFTPVKDAKGEPATFYLHTYRMIKPIEALPVAICCRINGKNYILEAESDSVKLSEQQLPRKIENKTSKFIFYQKIFSPGHNYLRFESSSEPGFYLAWDREEKKLTLKLPEDPIDEYIKFLLD